LGLCAAIILAGRLFKVRRILGLGDVWITEYSINYQDRTSYDVSIMEFRNDKVVHETQYFAGPFEVPILAEPVGAANKRTS
jgi:hypothetical protein